MKALGNALGVIEPVDTDDLHAIEDRRLQARCILARLIAGRHLGELLGIDADRKCLGHHRAAVGAQAIAIGTAARFAQYVIAEALHRSDEHTSELQSLMRISYAVFCLKKKNNQTIRT